MPRVSKYPWYHYYIRNRVRQVFQFSQNKAKKAALERAKGICEMCELPGAKDVDHIDPCVPVTGWDDWNGYISRTLDIEASDLQVLCKNCHKIKTDVAAKERKKNEKKGD